MHNNCILTKIIQPIVKTLIMILLWLIDIHFTARFRDLWYFSGFKMANQETEEVLTLFGL